MRVHTNERCASISITVRSDFQHHLSFSGMKVLNTIFSWTKNQIDRLPFLLNRELEKVNWYPCQQQRSIRVEKPKLDVLDGAL